MTTESGTHTSTEGFEKIATPEEIVEIPIDQLNSDFPTDRDHVNALRNSIEQIGIQISPITVWQQDLELIDGFHRLKALKQLKFNSAKCIVHDCEEEEFRDLKIASATTHKNVTFARVLGLVREAFAETEWAGKIEVADAFEIDRSANFPKAKKRAQRKYGFSEEEIDGLVGWLNEKSKAWDLNPRKIANMLKLEDLASPKLISLVRDGGSRAKDNTITRRQLGYITRHIEDHTLQEAVARKAISERLSEEQAKDLVRVIAHAPSDEQVEKTLTTSWVEIVEDKKRKRKEQESSEKVSPEEQRRRNERFGINMAISVLKDAQQLLEKINFSNHPNLLEEFSQTLDELVLNTADVQGQDIDIAKRLSTENDKLKGENKQLLLENAFLKNRVESLEKTMGFTKEVQHKELKSRDQID